tara:strand:- start:5202 stop:5504 length:303 start_codon:yes stop_codon:yes gene_type:complete
MKLIIIFLLFLIAFSCNKQNEIISFSVTETSGTPRELEYIQVEWDMQNKPIKGSKFSISGKDGISDGQIIKVNTNKGKYYDIASFFIYSKAQIGLAFIIR